MYLFILLKISEMELAQTLRGFKCLHVPCLSLSLPPSSPPAVSLYCLFYPSPTSLLGSTSSLFLSHFSFLQPRLLHEKGVETIPIGHNPSLATLGKKRFLPVKVLSVSGAESKLKWPYSSGFNHLKWLNHLWSLSSWLYPNFYLFCP